MLVQLDVQFAVLRTWDERPESGESCPSPFVLDGDLALFAAWRPRSWCWAGLVVGKRHKLPTALRDQRGLPGICAIMSWRPEVDVVVNPASATGASARWTRRLRKLGWPPRVQPELLAAPRSSYAAAAAHGRYHPAARRTRDWPFMAPRSGPVRQQRRPSAHVSRAAKRLRPIIPRRLSPDGALRRAGRRGIRFG